MALDWTNKINNVDNVDANDVNTLAAAIKDVEQSVTTEDGKLTDHKTKAVLDHPDSSVTTNKIANGAVSTDKIAPSAVTGSRIANNAVTDTKIADGAVTTLKIGKNAVGTDNIKDAAVDSAKIVNGSIAARHIIDGQVTRDKIAADSISSDKIANKSVTTEKIEDNAVTTSKIADGEISEAKLAATLSDKINRKANKSDLTADNIISVYSSKLKPYKLVNKPDFPKMTGNAFVLNGDMASVTDIGGAYVPTYTIDYVWKQQHRNITSTTYFVSYHTGSSSATGLNPGAALKYPSDAMTKVKSGDTIIVMDGYYPRNQLGFDQNKSVHIQGGIFCNADNNRSLTWTLVEGTTYKTTRSQAFSVYQANDDGSAFTEFVNPPTLYICKSTPGSYFIDGDTVYVNTPNGYSGAPGYDILVSLNAVGATINTNVWCENTVFVFGGQAACLNRSSTDPALFSDCTFKYAKQNGFMSQGGKSYLLNCESYNNGRDGFSYKKLNSNVSYGFEVGCTAHHNGDDESTGSDNGSTAHEGSIVTRINGKYYENKGPNIADVNPGTMSYNLNCACSNSTATAQDRRIDYNIEDGIMYLDRCTSDGSFISLYEASVTILQTTKSYNLGSVLPGVYRVKNANGVAENLRGGEDIANKVKSISSRSTDVQYPSAKAVNDVVSAQKTDMVQNYANALKGKVSGNNAVRIDDSSPIKHKMNVRVSSKNVILYPYANTTKTVNGITFTDNGDGSITINGTATAAAAFSLSENLRMNLSGIYTLSKNVPNVYLYIAYYKNNSYIGEKAVSGNNTFALVDLTSIDCDRVRCAVQIKAGAVFNNAVLKPQLELGSTATDYVPYVGPTSVTLSEYGKNLIDGNLYSQSVTDGGITVSYSDADNTFTLNGTAERASNVRANVLIPLKNIPATLSARYVSGTLNLGSGYGLFYLGKGDTQAERINFIPTPNFTTGTIAPTAVNLTDKQYITVVWFYTSAGGSYNNYKVKLQLEIGSEPTDIVPYKSPNTSTPSADGTVTGVNNIYPTTSLLSNKDNVVIDVEYNRDINKAFEELQNAILAQGSNT